MSDHVLDSGSCGLEILSGVKVVGMLVKVLTDGCGHCKTKVGVDVYLSYGHGCSLTKLILGNTDSAGHVAAVFVDDPDKFLRNG